MADETGQAQSQETNLETAGDGTTVRTEVPEGQQGQQGQTGQTAGATTEGGKGEAEGGEATGESSLLGGAAAEEGEPQPKPWMTSLPAELKSNPEYVKALNQFDSQNEVIRAYLEGKPAASIQELIAAASDEDRAKLWKAIGRPDSAAGYAIKMDLPKEIPSDGNLIEGFKTAAFEAGLNQAQAQSIVDYYNKQLVSTFNNQVRQYQRSMQEGERDLRSTWKDQFNENIAKTRRTAQEIFSPQTLKVLNQAGIANNPHFIQDVFNIAERTSEDTLITSETEPATKERTPGRFHYPSMESEAQ